MGVFHGGLMEALVGKGNRRNEKGAFQGIAEVVPLIVFDWFLCGMFFCWAIFCSYFMTHNMNIFLFFVNLYLQYIYYNDFVVFLS